MLHELKKSEFYLCKKLVDERTQLEARAVIYGTATGRVFVDDPDVPKVGLVWLGNNDGFIFIGDETAINLDILVNSLIDERIKEEAKQLDVHYFEGMGCHPRWNEVIERMFASRNTNSWLQYVYRLEPDNNDIRDQYESSSNYNIVALTSILTQVQSQYKDITNIKYIESNVLQFWPTIQDFLDNGIGYCIVVNDTITSFCFSSFVLDNTHCVNIETIEQYRRGGYARAVAQAFANECAKRNYVVYWDCMASNLGSVSIAEQIGCKRDHSYTGYYFKF